MSARVAAARAAVSRPEMRPRADSMPMKVTPSGTQIVWSLEGFSATYRPSTGGGGPSGPITVADIDSQDAGEDQVIAADGAGAAVWDDQRVTVDNFLTGSAALNQVLRATGSGGAYFSDELGEVAYVENTAGSAGTGDIVVMCTTDPIDCLPDDVFVLNFFCPAVDFGSSNHAATVYFGVDADHIGRTQTQAGAAIQLPWSASRRVTGLTDSHVFTVSQLANDGSTVFNAGDGTNTSILPISLQVLKVAS